MSRDNYKLLSFIIPVYNVEQYLNECIDSILSQITGDCEIILIDDGSTDASAKICDEYCEHYKNIKVLHKENSGPSESRNMGLELAQGRYVAFVDSDDRVDVNCIQPILNWIQNFEADICFMNAVKFFKDESIEDMADGIEREYIAQKERLDVLKYLSTRPKFSGSACTKLYKKSFLEDNHLLFPTDGELGEDLYFVRDCLLNANSFDALNVPYYQYRQNRELSRTKGTSESLFLSLYSFARDSAAELLQEKNAIDFSAKYAMSWVAYEYMIMLWHYSNLDYANKEKYYAATKELAWVMKFSGEKKTKFVNLMIKVFGIKFTARMLNFYMSHRG